jgi:hypothetical protein
MQGCRLKSFQNDLTLTIFTRNFFRKEIVESHLNGLLPKPYSCVSAVFIQKPM